MSEKVEVTSDLSSSPLVSPEFEAGLEMLAKRSPEALRATLPLLETQVNNDVGTVICVAPFLSGLFCGSILNIKSSSGGSLNVAACVGFVFSIILAVGTFFWFSGGRRRKSASELAAVKMAIEIEERGEEIVRRVSTVTTRTVRKE